MSDPQSFCPFCKREHDAPEVLDYVKDLQSRLDSALKLKEKLLLDTGKGCSVCGHTPVVNIPGGSGTYWLCGDCVAERLEELDSQRHAAETIKTFLDESDAENKALMSRLDESMKASAELRAKGRAAWEVLERYLLETRSLDLNKMPGSDDMLIALTGIRFLPPDEADIEWARKNIEKLQASGVEIPATNSTAHVHDFKPSALVPGENVCSCGHYYVVSE